jgi:hypothetical protein
MKKYVNGELVDMTSEEISVNEIEVEQRKADKILETEKKTNAETKKSSGKQKLKDLGLTDDEIQALIGV